MSLLRPTTPQPQPAVETPPDHDRCVSCRRTGTTLEDRTIDDAGTVRVCADPIACRLAAQRAGIWCN